MAWSVSAKKSNVTIRSFSLWPALHFVKWVRPSIQFDHIHCEVNILYSFYQEAWESLTTKKCGRWPCIAPLHFQPWECVAADFHLPPPPPLNPTTKPTLSIWMWLFIDSRAWSSSNFLFPHFSHPINCTRVIIKVHQLLCLSSTLPRLPTKPRFAIPTTCGKNARELQIALFTLPIDAPPKLQFLHFNDAIMMLTEGEVLCATFLLAYLGVALLNYSNAVGPVVWCVLWALVWLFEATGNRKCAGDLPSPLRRCCLVDLWGAAAPPRNHWKLSVGIQLSARALNSPFIASLSSTSVDSDATSLAVPTLPNEEVATVSGVMPLANAATSEFRCLDFVRVA